MDVKSRIEIVQTLTLSFWSFGLIFFFCYFGQCLTTRYEELSIQIYCCDWHLFPMQAKKMLPVILNILNKTEVLQGFGNVFYTHEAFKKVTTNEKFYYIKTRFFSNHIIHLHRLWGLVFNTSWFFVKFNIRFTGWVRRYSHTYISLHIIFTSIFFLEFLSFHHFGAFWAPFLLFKIFVHVISRKQSSNKK